MAKVTDIMGAWVAQLVERSALAQVTISWFVGSSPVIGLSALSTGGCFGFPVPPLFLPLSHSRSLFSKININRGAWVAQSVERLTSAQVMISRSVSSSPTSGFVLTAQNLGPVSDSVSPSLSDPPPFMLCLSLSQK